MNIVVVGPGAIGSLWACKLQQAGHTVSLWGTQQVQQWELSCDDNASQVFPYNQTSSLKHTDLILVTVKAWQVKAALLPLLENIHPDTILLFMHNGMGAIDQLAQELSSYPTLIATTTHGALKLSAHQVRHTGLGQTQVGAYNRSGEQCSFVAEVLNHALPAVEWNSDIQHALWNKLAINCAINPLTAIHQCFNGDLAQPEYRSQLDDIINEVVAVMKAEHIPVNKKALTDTINRVINSTASNKSSMHQDIFYQRQTEIDFITGYVVRKAQQHGIMVPENTRLYNQIKTLEQIG